MALRETRKGACCDGFLAAGARKGKYGVALIAADSPAVAAGVFTKNTVKAAPLKITKKVVEGRVSLIVANSGNANACTRTGIADAKKVQEGAAATMGVSASSVAVASTGIIGKPLDTKTVLSLVKAAAKKLGRSGKSSLAAAKAIMTTDTRIKQVSVEYKGIQVGGVCKGAGMIAPNMATMLCFITTNADVGKRQLQSALVKSAEKSFNMISIDGDQSTNDMILLLSSGKEECSPRDFQRALDYVTVKLAKMIAKDGEGATKFIEVEVGGAKNTGDARKAVHAILDSPLIKTALFGENPNWGRIMAKLGSVLRINEKKVDITFQSENGKVKVALGGVSTGKNKSAAAILKSKEVRIMVDLHSGRASAVGWGCDLTPDYVKINAGYS